MPGQYRKHILSSLIHHKDRRIRKFVPDPRGNVPHRDPCRPDEEKVIPPPVFPGKSPDILRQRSSLSVRILFHSIAGARLSHAPEYPAYLFVQFCPGAGETEHPHFLLTLSHIFLRTVFLRTVFFHTVFFRTVRFPHCLSILFCLVLLFYGQCTRSACI